MNGKKISLSLIIRRFLAVFIFFSIAFGIIMVIACEVGFLTPPVGANLFVAARITNLGIDRISIAVLPFVFAYIVILTLIAAFPDITTILPNFFYGKFG